MATMGVKGLSECKRHLQTSVKSQQHRDSVDCSGSCNCCPEMFPFDRVAKKSIVTQSKRL